MGGVWACPSEQEVAITGGWGQGSSACEFLEQGGGGPGVGLWAPELSTSSAGPGRPGLQDTDWALPSLGLGRLGGRYGLWWPGGSGASHAGPSLPRLLLQALQAFRPGSPWRRQSPREPARVQGRAESWEEGAPPIQPSRAPQPGGPELGSTTPVSPNPHQDHCSRPWEGIMEHNDKESLPEWGWGWEVRLHVSSQMHTRKSQLL